MYFIFCLLKVLCTCTLNAAWLSVHNEICQNRISVEQLDFSVPPPSLHSNFRPPALSAPALYCPDTDSIGGVARRKEVQGINPIPPARYTFGHCSWGDLGLIVYL